MSSSSPTTLPVKPAAIPRPGRAVAVARRTAYGLTGLALFIVLWKAADAWGWVPAGTLPDPFGLPQAFAQEWQSGRLAPAIESSLIHYVWGLSLGTVFGVVLGGAAATVERIDLLLHYLVRILRPIPPLAWVIFAIAWFKVSHAGAAFVIAIGVFWVNYFATYSAVRNVDPRLYELARAFGQGGYLARSITVTWPASAPGALSGIRTGIGQAWMTLIAAELLGVPGMGQEMNAAAGVGAYDAVVVYMLVISAIYTLFDFAFGFAERKVLQWRP